MLERLQLRRAKAAAPNMRRHTTAKRRIDL